jgi:hypothetical protein
MTFMVESYLCATYVHAIKFIFYNDFFFVKYVINRFKFFLKKTSAFENIIILMSSKVKEQINFEYTSKVFHLRIYYLINRVTFGFFKNLFALLLSRM